MGLLVARQIRGRGVVLAALGARVPLFGRFLRLRRRSAEDRLCTTGFEFLAFPSRAAVRDEEGVVRVTHRHRRLVHGRQFWLLLFLLVAVHRGVLAAERLVRTVIVVIADVVIDRVFQRVSGDIQTVQAAIAAVVVLLIYIIVIYIVVVAGTVPGATQDRGGGVVIQDCIAVIIIVAAIVHIDAASVHGRYHHVQMLLLLTASRVPEIDHFASDDVAQAAETVETGKTPEAGQAR